MISFDAVEQGPEDVLDVCKLTCLEQGVKIVDVGQDVPILRIEGVRVFLEMPEGGAAL